MKQDVVIVGSGLFGEIIAKALRRKGRECLIIDREEEEAGSRPAACLFKPSWYSGLGKEVHVPALALLDELYGVQEVEFKVAMTTTKVNWIPPSMILGQEDRIYGDVFEVKAGSVLYRTPGGGAIAMMAELVIVAAGIWTQELVPGVEQKAQKGIVFLDPGAHISTPFIRPWAPYKQIVGFNRGDGLWVGDGSSILEKNWTAEREDQCFDRCQKAVSTLGLNAHRIVGIRPYAKGHKPCLLEKIEPGLWVASGGAKNGTLAAGWCGHIIGEATS